MKVRYILMAAAVVGTVTSVAINRQLVANAAQSCETLASLRISNASITAVQEVARGAFIPPGSTASSPGLGVYRDLPAFCRVQGVIQPSSDSHIEFEVWLPSSEWNGKYLGVGNGGLAGSIDYSARAGSNAPDMAQALAGGYATSSTDTGHKAVVADADWALGHPEKIIDFGYRAIHETAVASKAVVGAFYGRDPRESYFNSCSNGGRQALMEAQRYPSDYIGIVAGDPAYFSTHQNANNIWNAQALMNNPASYIPLAKLPAIDAAVLTTCDALDGLKDGVITEPTKCHFDPAILLCTGAESSACLTQPQVEALKKIYAGPRTSKGEQIFPGMLPGDEAGPRGWNTWIVGPEPGKSLQFLFGVEATGKMTFQNPAWDFRTFNFDRDVAFLDEKAGPSRNATNPDLTPFKARGGKLILYHGWSDSAIAPLNTVNYYDRVISKMGRRDADNFVRLYMVPGMQHCGGGPGPNVLDMLSGSNADPQHSVQLALEQWVERGTRPDEIIVTQYKGDGGPANDTMRTRPVCPYPQVARYIGTGNMNDATSFTCKATP